MKETDIVLHTGTRNFKITFRLRFWTGHKTGKEMLIVTTHGFCPSYWTRNFTKLPGSIRAQRINFLVMSSLSTRTWNYLLILFKIWLRILLKLLLRAWKIESLCDFSCLKIIIWFTFLQAEAKVCVIFVRGTKCTCKQLTKLGLSNLFPRSGYNSFPFRPRGHETRPVTNFAWSLCLTLCGPMSDWVRHVIYGFYAWSGVELRLSAHHSSLLLCTSSVLVFLVRLRVPDNRRIKQKR
jgi:hypothetical protein